MVDRPIVLIRLNDAARAEVLAAALETDGDFFAVVDAVEPPDVTVEEGGDTIRISSGETGGTPAAALPIATAELLIAAAVRVVAAGYALTRVATDGDDGDEPEHDAVRGAPPLRPPLSAREKEVLVLLADGASNKVIARALDISVHTAKFHIASLLSKLGAVNRTDALATAMREGLIPM